MNTPERWETTAKVLDGARRALWLPIFEDAIVPIKSMFTIKTDLPGHPGAEAYMLDLDAISPDQRTKMIDVLATRFNISRDEIADEIEKGVPILADGVTVISSAISLRQII